MGLVHIESLGPERHRDAGRILAESLLEDPYYRPVFGATGLARLRRYMESGVKCVAPEGHSFVATDDGVPVGALLAIPPRPSRLVHWRFRLSEIAEPFRIGFVASRRMRRRDRRSEPVHRRGGSWRVCGLGVLPGWQGRGIGGRLLAALAERADREGRAIFLATANPRNVPFYRRHGFLFCDDALAEDGCAIQFLVREPARRSPPGPLS